MPMLFVSEIVIFLSVIGLTRGAVCPLVFAQKEFDIENYAGIWYEAYRHDINEDGIKCINGTYVASTNGTMNVSSEGYNKLSGHYSHQGVARPKSPSEPASLLIHYTNPTKTVKYEVIATDYDQYSIIYSCDYFPIVGIRFEHVWFLGRNKTLPESTVTALKKILRDKLIETSDITLTAQDC